MPVGMEAVWAYGVRLGSGVIGTHFNHTLIMTVATSGEIRLVGLNSLRQVKTYHDVPDHVE